MYGLSCLQPDFRYSFPFSELFFDMPVLEKDIESIGDIYHRYSDKPPNTYIFLFNGRLQFQSGGVFGKYFYIGLFDADKSFDAGFCKPLEVYLCMVCHTMLSSRAFIKIAENRMAGFQRFLHGIT